MANLKRERLKYLKLDRKRRKSELFIDLAIGLIFLWIFLQNFGRFLLWARSPLKRMILYPLASYEQKMRTEIGRFYEYIQFVNEQTPEDAVVLHPKQQSRWPKVSNQGYTRYFIYPRDLVSEDEEETKKEKATHIFIVGRKNLDLGYEQDQWPNEKVKAKRLIYMPESPGKEVIILEKDYDPQDEINDRWGIIELER